MAFVVSNDITTLKKRTQVGNPGLAARSEKASVIQGRGEYWLQIRYQLDAELTAPYATWANDRSTGRPTCHCSIVGHSFP